MKIDSFATAKTDLIEAIGASIEASSADLSDSGFSNSNQSDQKSDPNLKKKLSRLGALVAQHLEQRESKPVKTAVEPSRPKPNFELNTYQFIVPRTLMLKSYEAAAQTKPQESQIGMIINLAS